MRIAVHGIAEAARRGPDDGVDVGRMLLEILLAQLQRHLLAHDIERVLDHFAGALRRSAMSLPVMKR